ncbi:hypothetical protein I2I11_01610 [Pontibacter sp. 172403-2]|uniref:hypothetical protein n=1 Tax=Pontibacter rufus TaxID=2791028 RepID=UPI0018AF575B|nr:hypothetical protein [Pontibacter sp. 172403-2]MBF9251980.1 hypothetical protein [Pontibacter sp. 172403-2]
MKKICYSIFAVCTIFFATSCNTDEKGTSMEVADANNNEDVDPEHIRDYAAIPGSETNTDIDEQYRSNADEMTAQVAADLQLNDGTKSRVRDVYYNRSKKLGDLRNGNTAGSSSGGSDVGTGSASRGDAPIEANTVDTLRADANAQANNNTTMPAADMEAARQRINDEANRQLQTILTPEQWKMYEQNRAKYDKMQKEIDVAFTDPTSRMKE